MSASRAALAAASVIAIAVAGCGGGGGGKRSAGQTTPAGSSSTGAQSGAAPTGAAGGGHTLRIKADPSGQLKFNVSSLQASAGKVKIVMANPSQLSHSVAIEGGGVNAAGEVVGPGGTSTVSATLKPGKYTFFCTVPGHREAGMQGTLTVK
jgi:uncharacterized cupredoxin-like copper-binding protein